jgi:TPR repeat protein
MLSQKFTCPPSTIWNSIHLLHLCIAFFALSHIQTTVARNSILKESLASIQSKALAGDVHYQGGLAIFHKFGEKGLAIDFIEAERWAKLAAQKQGSLGLCTLASLELERGNSERGRFLYDEAYLHSNLRSVVKHQDPIALFCMGMIEIDNPPRNFAKGIRQLSKSAEMGFATAQATLGMIYFSGIGVKKNPELAIKWCSRAAREKHPLGMFYLGMAYSTGDGVAQNDDYALRWIRAAADRQLTMAQLTLGMKLATGDGTEKNLELAVEWLGKAATRGKSPEAKLQLRRYENQLLRMRTPTAAYVPDDQEKSAIQLAQRQILKKGPPRENRFESSRVAPPKRIPSPPTPVPPTRMTDLTIDGTKDAALQGDLLATKNLGLKHYAAKDFKQARKWFEIAAIKNEPESLRYLGILYFMGQGVELDYKLAAQWFTKAVRAGDLESTRYLRIVKQFKQ